MSFGARLRCYDAIASHRDLRFKQLPRTVGRGHAADVQLQDCWASRVHCRFELRRGKLWVIDLQSANGTLVNGVPTTESELTLNDSVTIGVTTFKVDWLRLPNHVDSGHEYEAIPS